MLLYIVSPMVYNYSIYNSVSENDKMHILIANDDGIFAPGIRALANAAKAAGHRVTVFAPDSQRSAASHAFTLKKPLRAVPVEYEDGITAFAVDGTPADCVRLGLYLTREDPVDCVLSGINNGSNRGAAILYSGTVAAVFEAAALGMKAIAVSTEPKAISTAWEELDRIWEFFCKHELLQKHSIYNVNIPRNAGAIRITRQGGPYYSDDFLPEENDMYRPQGKPVYAPSNDCLDTDTVLTRKEISVMPLTIQRVDMAAYEALQTLNEA